MNYAKSIVLAIMDACAVNAALFISFLLRFEGRIPNEYTEQLLTIAIVITFIRLVFFVIFGLYRSLWRYSSLPELFQVVKAVTASSIVFWTLITLFPFIHVPRSVGVMTWVINIFLIGGIRLAVRLWREFLTSRRKSVSSRRILIVGAGYAGAMVARQMQHNPECAMIPIAFVDDDPSKLHKMLYGVPIAGRITDINQMIANYKPNEILIAIPSASRAKIREIVDNVRVTNVPVRILPNLLDSTNSGVSLKQIREVQIEDLLGREPVQVDLSEIAGYLRGERVMVTGAGGSIGSELCRQIAKFEPEKLLVLGRGENSIYEIDQELNFLYGSTLKKLPIIADVRDRVKMEQVFREYHPTVVFHAAAHKHVPLMENAPEEAVKNNVFGTKNVAELSEKYGIKRFVMISTDKAVNPTNVMGATKRVAEMVVQHLAKTSKTKFCAVRFGNVLGSRGSVIPLFKKQIERGGPLTVTHPEMTRFFMTIPEAVSLVIQAGAMGERGEVFILDMGEPVKIYDLATELIRLSGLRPEVDIPIVCTGIRPGEKLYEEILTEEEGTTATKHKRIYVGRPNGVNWGQLSEDLVYLEKWIAKADHSKVVEKLQQMVPNYIASDQWKKEVAVSREDIMVLHDV